MMQFVDYINPTNGASTAPGPVTAFEKMLDIQRNGIGVRYVLPSYGTGTLNISTESFELLWKKLYDPDPDVYFVQTLLVPLPAKVVQKFEIGPTVRVGDKYTLAIGPDSVTYEVPIGVTDPVVVAAALVTLFNAYSWPYTTDSATSSGRVITTGVSKPAVVVGTLTPGYENIYMNGYRTLANFGAGNQYYVLFSQQDPDAFLPLPPVAGSYVYDSSNVAPGSFDSFVQPVGYFLFSSLYTPTANSQLTNAPVVNASGNEVTYDPDTGITYFPSGLELGQDELIKWIFI